MKLKDHCTFISRNYSKKPSTIYIFQFEIYSFFFWSLMIMTYNYLPKSRNTQMWSIRMVTGRAPSFTTDSVTFEYFWYTYK